MKPSQGVMMALLLFAQALFPAAASARAGDQDHEPARPARIEFPPVLGGAAQGSSIQKRPSAGRQLLRNALIGAAVGATLMGAFARATGDCGSCGSDQAKAIVQVAMYGALVGAAIGLHPSRRSSPSHSPRQTTVSPKLTMQVKS